MRHLMGKWTLPISALALVVLCVGVWQWMSGRAPTGRWQEVTRAPAEQSPEQVVRFVLSEVFGELSEDSRLDYLDRVRRLGPERGVWVVPPTKLTDRQRANVEANVVPIIRRMVDRHVEHYTRLPESQRAAYLDGLIDEMAARHMAAMAHRQQQGTTQPASFGPGALTPERLRMRIEDLTPEQRARRAVFMKDMRQRVTQRGMDMLNPIVAWKIWTGQ